MIWIPCPVFSNSLSCRFHVFQRSIQLEQNSPVVQLSKVFFVFGSPQHTFRLALGCPLSFPMILRFFVPLSFPMILMFFPNFPWQNSMAFPGCSPDCPGKWIKEHLIWMTKTPQEMSASEPPSLSRGGIRWEFSLGVFGLGMKQWENHVCLGGLTYEPHDFERILFRWLRNHSTNRKSGENPGMEWWM